MTYLVVLLLMLGTTESGAAHSPVEFVNQNSSVAELVKKCAELKERIRTSGLDTPELRLLARETTRESDALERFTQHKDKLPCAPGACGGCLLGSTVGILVGVFTHHPSAVENPDSVENPLYLLPLAFVCGIARVAGLTAAIERDCLVGCVTGTGLGGGAGWAMDAHNRRTRMNLHRKQVNVLVDRLNRASSNGDAGSFPRP